MIKTAPVFVALLFVPSVLLLLEHGALGVVAATTTDHHHHKRHQEKEHCKDRPRVHCRIIAEDGDCGKFTNRGESYAASVCRVSCGSCDPVDDEIVTDHSCYKFGKESIGVSFSNRVPHLEDWVGIYPDTADPMDLGPPVAWFWLCGDKKSKCKTSVGSVTFPWLPPGNYKAVMSRNRNAKGPYANYGPYVSYAESQPFEVARGDMCASRRLAQNAALRGMQ
mmetsp:Transcript_5070/g.14718  ORF Transcript_5070/g.14718 Transcript_5070/m.14718 type:complete len:222 (-) Transcript_5070:166-831(-)|eukprot:CAMPEP_0172357236 /NCGR_PEP_ID=MMETSP1060-20121228/1612_1 /TAXON_ID=37318 /ORGANISM="Pseudo-nitzschia pungens, Strain cf. cingulata" /LENGTH=221 /DNA_ID=CAMNT_0013077803 /DNA_START=171 /DNA_END=836 /DNA_ORIENTATION=+